MLYTDILKKAQEEYRSALQESANSKAKYRRELVDQMQQDRTRKSKSREKEIKEDKLTTGLSLGYYRRNSNFEANCYTYNMMTAEKKRTRSQAKNRLLLEGIKPSEEEPTAVKETKVVKDRWSEYYKSEIGRRETEKKAQREYKRREKVGIEERINVIQKEVDIERKRARQNQAEIRQILAAQIDAKNQTRMREREEERHYRKLSEAISLVNTPEKVTRFGKCTQCSSPIK